MQVDQRLFDAAVEQLRRRWPEGHGGVAAAVYLDDGSIVTGVALANINAVMGLCAETGPICQAYTTDRAVAASICVAREPGGRELQVLAPCGACQERLALWGPGVEVGVVSTDSDAGWESKPLIEVNPYYWAAVYAEGSGWPTPAEHAD
ncbi:MAG TPA: cytidine deaminase [Acidimicrobiales bacterium]